MGHWVSARDLEDPTLEDAEEAALAASQILFALSGKKYPGMLTVTEQFECDGGGCFSFARRGAKATMPYLRLRRPVRRVHYVVAFANNEDSRRIIDRREYRVDHRYKLVPTRYATWRPCDDIEVTYSYGVDPTAMGRRAAKVLANQLLRARVRPDECELPSRVTSISRQGISMTMLDPQDFLQDGRTGLYEVDLFLKSVNPDRARVRSRVFSPDLSYGHRISSSRSHGENEFDLVITPGLQIARTFIWSAGGAAQLITGEYVPTAIVKNYLGEVSLDLSEYLIVEANGEIGRLDLEVPATITQNLDLFGTWDLKLTRVGDPSVVIELVSGDVVTMGA